MAKNCQIEIKENFPEKGGVAIGFTMTGLDDQEGTPNTFYWTLTDVNKNVINSREDVSETPAATTWVILKGDDLAVIGTSTQRILTIYGDYDTTLDGTPVLAFPFTGEYKFDICDFKNIS